MSVPNRPIFVGMTNFVEFLYSKFLLSNGVSTDTRTLQGGNIFFALSGPHFCANEFALEALEKGATYAVVDDERFVTDERIILAEDSLTALQQLATFHRSRFKCPVLAITGSNGKTTTKELISSVLSKAYITCATKGNYNNHIGVPLTLLHVHPQVEISIIEMGASHIGDIAQLCEYAQPTHGLITNIGHAHTEGFGGFEGIIRGKSELFDYLRNRDGEVFINMDDPVLANMFKRFDRPLIYPCKDIKLISSLPFLEIELNGKKVRTQLTGKYNFENIACAVVVGRAFKIPDSSILNAIATYKAENLRSQVIQKDDDVTIISDAYNANPDSMRAALENLAEQQGEKTAIIGDMNELENSDEEHLKILALADKLKIDRILTVGYKIGRVRQSDHHFDTRDKLASYLNKEKFSGSVILLKASRSIQLDIIVENIN